MKRILIPLPDRDFDVTEVAVPWKLWKNQGYEITFATEAGKIGQCDPLLLTGVIFGKLGATAEAIGYYREMTESAEFQHPIPYAEIRPEEYDLLHLPGGHAQGMKQYLESKTLQGKVLAFFKAQKLVGSICHGPIVLARTIDPATGKSVIHGRKVAALTKFLERLAYYITAWKLGKYYRTYPAYVQDEVAAAMGDSSNFQRGPKQFEPFVFEDGNLVTARWPKDSWLYAGRLILRLEEKQVANISL
jgi:putative intracellular protease/amidase